MAFQAQPPEVQVEESTYVRYLSMPGNVSQLDPLNYLQI
jgi:hypothetical protein